MTNIDGATIPEPTIDFPQYVEMVNVCAGDRMDHLIANGNAQHARYLIQKLFQVARSQVQIVSGCLRQTDASGLQIYSYPAVIEAARNFLRRPGSNLSIVIQKEVDGGAQNAFVAALRAIPDRQGKIDIIVSALGRMDETPHFMVADRQMFRLENPKDGIAAIANFGDPKTASELADFFGDIVSYLTTTKSIASHELISGAAA